MRETSNYKLNQWDKTDRIEMEDFNEDNRKIDAALAAEKQARENADAAQLSTLRSENVWAKLTETTLSAAASSVTLTMPDLSGYQAIILQYGTKGCGDLNLKLNNGANMYTSSSNSTVSSLSMLSNGNSPTGGFIWLFEGIGIVGTYRCASYSYGLYTNNGIFLCDELSLTGLEKLVLSTTSGSMAVGSCFKVYGLKK